MPFAASLSTAPDVARALGHVADEALAQLGDMEPDLAVVFFSPHHADSAREIASDLMGRLEARCLLGCMGESIAGGAREVEDGPALALWLAKFDEAVSVEPFHLQAEQTSEGWSLLGWPDGVFEADPVESLLLVLGDPHTFPAADLFLPRVNEEFPGLAVVGGMSSGAPSPEHTALLLNDSAAGSGAVGVLLRGPLRWRSVVSQGCRPIGRPLVVTRGRENVIQEVGGLAPLEYLRDLYQELPPRDQKLLENGLNVGLVISEYRETFGRGDFLIRNIYGIDRESGALVITDRIRVGQTVQFQVRDADTADEDLRALLHAAREAGSKPAGGLLFSCNGRGTRLFPQPNHDAAAIQAEAGPLPLAGFFAAGELGPVGGRNFIHGFTASVVLFEEEE